MKEKNGTKAFYVRVSTGKQALRETPIPTQVDLLERLANVKTKNEYILYKDEGISGSNLIRPGIQKLMLDIVDNKISEVFVETQDRLSRDIVDINYFLNICHSKGVKVLTLFASLDISTPEGELSINSIAVSSKYHVSLAKFKTKKGMEKLASLGYYPFGGIAPYGFTKSKKNKRILLVNDEEAKIVRLMFDKAKIGWNSAQIRDWLNKNKIVPNKTFSKNFVKTILNRPINYGECILFGNLYEMTLCENIISKKEALSILASSRTRLPTNDYIFQSKLFCKCCGHKIYVDVTTKKTTKKVYKYYTCPQCKTRVSENNIQHLLRKSIFKLSKSPKEDVEIKFMKDKEKLLKKKEDLLEMFVDDKIDKITFMRIERLIAGKLKSTEQLIKDYQEAPIPRLELKTITENNIDRILVDLKTMHYEIIEIGSSDSVDVGSNMLFPTYSNSVSPTP